MNSVRQLTDASGAVTLAKQYQPYGEVLSSAGSGASVFGFDGESQANGLVYLRTRYYSEIGRFISKDVWQGDYARPMSYNNWLYVYANPINLTDPSGLSPTNSFLDEHTDDRDLTSWLYQEMITNADGYYAQRIQSLLDSPNLTEKTRAIFGWIFLVKNQAKWDPKHRIKELLEGEESVLLSSSKGSAWYGYSVPGNIHYGFVGRAAGFSGFMLHTGAGYAEVIDPAHKERGEACCPTICKNVINDPWITFNICVPLGCYYINPAWATNLFDDPSDYRNVEFGITLYDTYGKHMSFEQFQKHLAIYGGGLTPAPIIPGTGFSHPDWPYSMGYFDGPDTGKNKPIVDILLWRSPFGH